MEFLSIFGIVFVVCLVIIIYQLVARGMRNNKPIKKFKYRNETYYIYSQERAGHYGMGIVYVLKTDKNEFKGTFSSLQDILQFLNIDSFPDEDDIFNR